MKRVIHLPTSGVSCLVLAVLAVALAGIAANAAAPDKSGVKPSVISLPKGAGSIEGLGESFEPQLNTGGSSYGVSVAVPAGRAGLTPQVRLGYDSNSGNGLGGIGWTLEFMSVKRQTDKGFPGYTSSDTFVLGGEELVPLTDGTWRCENESAFRRLRQVDSNSDGLVDSWEVTDRNGTRHLLGRKRGTAGSWSAVEHPDKPTLPPMDRTYCWMLDSTVDVHGNRIDYEYAQGPGVLYPSRITWSHLAGAQHEVSFQYEARPDVFDDYRPTFSAQLDKRLAKIEVRSRGQLVRWYAFAYAHPAGSAEALAEAAFQNTGVSLLKRVTQHDRTGSTANFLPPLIFTYSGLSMGSAVVRSAENMPELDLAQSGGLVQLADVDGDALPDIFSTASAAGQPSQWVCLNRGEYPAAGGTKKLRFAAARMVSAQTPASLSLPETVIQDAKGKGLVDITCLTVSGATRQLDTFRNRTAFDRIDENRLGFELTENTESLTSAPSFVTFSDAATRLSDVNFDKRSDFVTLVKSGVQWRALTFHVARDGRWEQSSNVLPPSFNSAEGFKLADGRPNPCTQLSDMNGDRMTDLVCLADQASGTALRLTVSYWPLCGLGRYAERRELALQPGDSITVPSRDALQDVFVEDFTGDGLADLLILDGSTSAAQASLRVNLAGASLSLPLVRTGLPRYAPRAAANPTVFRIADLDGNGTTDLLFRNSSPDSWQYLELLPDGRAALLSTVDNSLGRRTSITYGTAVEDEQAARDTAHPWRTHAPIPLLVVRRISSTCSLDLNGDGRTDETVSEFCYRDPFFDGQEREFRGFTWAQRIDFGDDFLPDAVSGLMIRSPGWNSARTPTGQVGAPSLVTRYRFHTGANDLADNDSYPQVNPPAVFTDESTEKGGREEEVLKGRMLVEEKVDPWVLHGAVDAGFDAGCDAAAAAATEAGRTRLTPDAYVYSRTANTWTVRRLYRPAEPQAYRADQNADGVPEDYPAAVLAPPGRFAPGTAVLAGNGRSVSFAFVSRTVTQVHEANALLASHLSWPQRAVISTLATFDHDDFGNQTARRDFGVDGGPRDDERFTLTTYALGGTALQKWIISSTNSIRVTDENGTFVSRKDFFYDGLPFAGLASGQMGERALLSRVREFRDAASFIEASRLNYDAFGNVIEMRDPLANVRRITWDPVFAAWPVTETVVVGGGAPDLTFAAEYDFGFGTVTRSIDNNGNRTDYVYDSFSRPVKTVRPGDSSDLPTLRFEYEPADTRRGILYRYDAAGNLSLQTLVPGIVSRVITRQREVSGQPGELISAALSDGCGKTLAKVEEGAAAGTWIVKDATSYSLRGTQKAKWLPWQAASIALPQFPLLWPSGRPPLTDGTSASLVAAEIFTDPAGRELRTIQPPETAGGPRRESAVQNLPFEQRVFDAEDLVPGSPHFGTPTVMYSDGLGRMTGVDEIVKIADDGTPGPLASWDTRYSWDLNNQLTRIEDSQHNVKTMVYDGLQRLTSLNDPDRGAMTWTHDDASNVIETTDAKGQRIRMTYDGANRIRTEDYLDTAGITPDVEYTYDVPVAGLDHGHGLPGTAVQTKGMLALVRDLSGETHFSYDSRGRVALEVKRIPDAVLGSMVSWQTAYEYDAADRVTAVRFPDGDRVDYQFGSRGLVERIVGGATGDLISSIAYRPSGQTASVAYGNGVTTASTYDPRLRMDSLRTVKAGAALLDFSYHFDAASNITRIDDNRPLTGPRHNSQTFSHDSLYRLTRVVYPGLPAGSPGQIDWRYDRIGNMLAQTSTITHLEGGLSVVNLGTMDSGGTSGRVGRTGRGPADPPGPHALTRISGAGAPREYPYDANGNMTAVDGLACAWDFEDRLVAAENAAMRAEYTYDYNDRRITKKVTDKTAAAAPAAAAVATHYINRWFEVRDYDQPVKYVWNGNTRVARVTGTLAASAVRTQKLRLQKGWNLVALAVGGTQAQLDPAVHPVIDEALWWNASASAYVPLRAGAAVPAGVPAWLFAAAPAVITITGPSATGTPPSSLAAGSHLLANSSADLWNIPSVFPAGAELWLHHAGTSLWLPKLSGSASFLSDPSVLRVLPGQSVVVRTPLAAPFTPPPASLGIRFYHQDHVGSTAVITDASGTLVEETANYPFGHPRNQHKPAGLGEAYGFTQKERDAESGLHYFEARYHSGNLGRFVRVDSMIIHRSPADLADPQLQNLYSYCANRPLICHDPDGQMPQAVFGGGLGFVVGAGVEATSQVISKWDVLKAQYRDFGIEGVYNEIEVTPILIAGATGALQGAINPLLPAEALAAKMGVGGVLNLGSTVLKNRVAGKETSFAQGMTSAVLGAAGAGVGAKLSGKAKDMAVAGIARNAAGNVDDALPEVEKIIVQHTVDANSGVFNMVENATGAASDFFTGVGGGLVEQQVSPDQGAQSGNAGSTPASGP